MNLHQFRFVQEAVRRNLNLTETARALHTSQPGISKAIIELEEELGVEIFARHGKRLKRVTEPGVHVLKSIDLIMREVGNLRRIGEQYSKQDSGTLSIATTHTQARYVLPQPVAKLREAFPKVNVSLHQGSPDQVAQMLMDEVAEIGIATESLAQYADLITLPALAVRLGVSLDLVRKRVRQVPGLAALVRRAGTCRFFEPGDLPAVEALLAADLPAAR